ncbi:MAG: response regulator [Elusimicrobiota bacterium]
MRGESGKEIKVLVVDDHPLIAEGVRRALEDFRNIRIVGEAFTGEEGLRLVKELKPDIVLLDLSMHGMGGMEVARRLLRTAPKVKTIILSMHGEKEHVRQMVHSGAKGYLFKESSPQEISRAIFAVQAGRTFFSPDISAKIAGEVVRGAGRIAAPRDSPLTARETDVLSLIAEGLSNKEIAGRLGVGVRTVETHRGRLMDKLDIRTTAGLTKYAVSRGLSRIR